jgi:hypothetical protein
MDAIPFSRSAGPRAFINFEFLILNVEWKGRKRKPSAIQILDEKSERGSPLQLPRFAVPCHLVPRRIFPNSLALVQRSTFKISPLSLAKALCNDTFIE